jgi:hypothetical protein
MTRIFESPDKGETVYARDMGSTERVIHSESEKRKSLHDDIKESQLWGNIHRAAKTNPALQEALDRVKITYYLTADYENRYGNRKNTKT